jgi:hypothetical protein
MKPTLRISSIQQISIEKLKRELLLFDKVFISGLMHDFDEEEIDLNVRLNNVYWKSPLSNKEKQELAQVIPQLITDDNILINRREIVPDANKLNRENNKVFDLIMPLESEFSKWIIDSEEESKVNPDNLVRDIVQRANDILVRQTAVYVNALDEYIAIPNLESYYPIKELKTKKQQVYNLILNNIPLPSDKNSFEEILNFKGDSDAQISALALRSWITDVSHSNYNIDEIEEKFLHLLNQYEKSIKLHKLKTENSIIETVVIGGAEIIENLVKLQFSNVAKLFFKHKNDNIDLMELEMKGLGNELSFISKITNQIK